MKLERKNNGESQPMTPRSRSNRFPSLREGFDWSKCRSRSPLSFPLNGCKNHGGIGEKGRSRGSAMGGKNELGSSSSCWGRRPLYSVSKSDRYSPKIATRSGTTALLGGTTAGRLLALQIWPLRAENAQSRYYRTFSRRYYRDPGTTALFPGGTTAIPVLPHFFPVLSLGDFWLKTASQKLPYLLNPDSDFDVLGLVEITTTSPTTICIETSLSSKGG